jgi:hypothetical protein
VEKFKGDYFDKLKSAREQYLKRLDSCLSAETHKGNLDGAEAIRNEIQAHKDVQPAPPVAAPSLRLDGKWHVRATVSDCDFSFQNKIVEKLGSSPTSATYSIEGGSVVVRWPGKWIDRFTPVQDRLLFENWSPNDSSQFPNRPTGFGIATRAD